MTAPTRSLEAVLRNGLAPTNQLRLIVGEYGEDTGDSRYVNVVLDGETILVPNLNAAPAGAPGTVVYLLADRTRMLVLGTVI